MNTEPISKKHQGTKVTLVVSYKIHDAPPRPTPPTIEREITDVLVGDKGPMEFSTREPAWKGQPIKRLCGNWRVVI